MSDMFKVLSAQETRSNIVLTHDLEEVALDALMHHPPGYVIRSHGTETRLLGRKEGEPETRKPSTLWTLLTPRWPQAYADEHLGTLTAGRPSVLSSPFLIRRESKDMIMWEGRG